MSRRPRRDPLIIRDDDADSPARLEDGDAVEVWLGEACAESFPVQCEIRAVRVTGEATRRP